MPRHCVLLAVGDEDTVPRRHDELGVTGPAAQRGGVEDAVGYVDVGAAGDRPEGQRRSAAHRRSRVRRAGRRPAARAARRRATARRRPSPRTPRNRRARLEQLRRAASSSGTTGPQPVPTRSWAVDSSSATRPRSQVRSTRSPRPSSSTNRNRPGSAASSGRRRAGGRARAATGSQVGAAAGEAGLRRDHHVADQLVGARGQQPGRRDRLDDLVGQHGRPVRGHRAQLQVGPLGQVHVAVAVRLRDLGQRRERRAREPAADQPQPHQAAVAPRATGGRRRGSGPGGSAAW